MNYCGLDIAGVSSYMFVTDAQGRKLAAGPVATTKVALEARLRPFVRGGLAVAIEAGNHGQIRTRRLKAGELPEVTMAGRQPATE